MLPTDPAAPDPNVPNPKQLSFAALNALVTSSNEAANDPKNTPDAQNAAWDTRAIASQELEALDLAVFTGNTAQLQAAAAAMAPGMEQLKGLQQKISALGNDFKEAATVLGDIDKALAALGGLVSL